MLGSTYNINTRPTAGVYMTLIFSRLMVRPNAKHALEKFSIIKCMFSSVSAARSASSASSSVNRNSRTRNWKVFDLALKRRRSVKALPESECIPQCHNRERNIKVRLRSRWRTKWAAYHLRLELAQKATH